MVFGLLEETVVPLARRLRSGLCICVLNRVHGREGAILSQPSRAGLPACPSNWFRTGLETCPTANPLRSKYLTLELCDRRARFFRCPCSRG